MDNSSPIYARYAVATPALTTAALCCIAAYNAPLPLAALAVVLYATTIVLMSRRYASLMRRQQLIRSVAKRLIRRKRLQSRQERYALKMLNHVVHQRRLMNSDTTAWQRPLGSFSGDLILSNISECGRRYTLIADLTGHGIGAAIGAAPVASIFHATSRRGLPVSEIINELNDRLVHQLPPGFFCCAAILVADEQQLSVFNAGLPDLLLVSDTGELTSRFASTQIPLGIQTMAYADQDVARITCDRSQNIYAFTDGLIETKTSDNVPFDQETLEKLVKTPIGSDTSRIPRIKKSFERRVKGTSVSDDISIVEIRIC